MQLKKKYRNLPAALAFTLLAACGGSDGNNNAAVDNTKPYALSDVEKKQVEAGKTGNYLINRKENRNILLGNHVVHSHQAEGDETRRSYDARPFAQGFHEYAVNIVYPDNDIQKKGRILSYQGFRGGIFKVYAGNDDIDGYVYGYDTPADQWPNSGKATYQGIAFDQEHKGSLIYYIDFASKSGHGAVYDMGKYGNITLHSAVYEKEFDDAAGRDIYTNDGEATAGTGERMDYRTFLFGARAEEIGGYIELDDGELALYGTRGAIAE